jgi:S-(hydroxymethyl)glutathione dehydrogenase/alcohol dehydrogenase
MKTTAAVAFQAGKPLEIVTLDLEGPKAGEVLVEIKATGVCHTDAYTLSGNDPEGLFPAVLGHEGAGVVLEVGPGVTSLVPGDHVIPLYTPECRNCKFCLSGRTNLCQAIRSTQGKGLMPDGTSRFSYKGQQVLHYMGTSTFANHTVLPEIALAKIRKDAPFEKVCYIGCGVTTGVGAVINTAKVRPGSNVAVFGLGGIGLNVLQGARMVGADKIIGVDLNPEREAMARKFGMTHFINPKDTPDVVAAIAELTDGGVDYSFECIGLKQTAELCFAMLRPGGTATIIGMIPFGTKIELHGADFLRERRIQGSMMGSNRFRIDMPRLIEFYQQGRLPLQHLVSGRLKLEQINEGFAAMKAGGVARNVIMFDA